MSTRSHTSLNLEDSGLGEAADSHGLSQVAGIALAGALQSEHCRLTSLNLRGNWTSEATKATIQQSLPSAYKKVLSVA
jgi:hypothetical protein